MRSLHVLHVVNDSDTGGAQTLIANLAGCRPLELRVSCVVLTTPGQLHDRLKASVDDLIYLGLSRRSKNVPWAVALLKTEIRRLNPDVCQSHLLQSDLLTFLATRRMLLPLIWTLHTSGFSGEDPALTRMLVPIMARLSRYVSAVVACSESAANFAFNSGYRTDIQIIENGVRIPPYEPSSGSGFLHLGRWHPMKDHENLFAALAILHSWGVPQQVRCGGPSLDDADVHATLAKYPSIEVEMRGTIRDVTSALRVSRALIVSSRYGEALPMAGLEALALGVPVVATDVGSCRELVADPRLLVAPGRPEELAHAMALIASLDPSDYEALRQRSLRIAQGFSIERAAAKYERLYAELCALA